MPAHPRPGTMAGRRDTRAPGLLRGARQQRCGECLPHSGDTALARSAAAPQPADQGQLGKDEPHRNPVDTPDPHRASIPAGALWRAACLASCGPGVGRNSGSRSRLVRPREPVHPGPDGRAAGPVRTQRYPGDTPPGVQLVIFRLVQEALTNTMKHAGPGASAAVRLRLAPGEVRVDIRVDIAAMIDCLLCCGLPVGRHCIAAQQIMARVPLAGWVGHCGSGCRSCRRRVPGGIPPP